MKFEAVTIKDIAKALGLSTSTVSRALRDSYEISPETKQRVLEYAQKINYQPNPIALSLKERKSRSIGVIVCEIANSFFSQIINGIESVANERGYNIIIAQSHESAGRELLDLQFMASRSVDGIIMSVGSETSDYSFLKELISRGLPVVFFDRVAPGIETHKVIAGNFDGAYKAVNYLIEKGYRHIAAIANAKGLSITQERMAGYRQAFADNGQQVQESLIQYCEHGGLVHDELSRAFQELWKQKKKPDAIFAAADKLTTGCLRILKQKQLKVPEDVALIGFSNNDLTELLDPPLSIIKQPAFEMGVAATELLLQQIESKRPVTAFETRVMPAELIIRQSS